MPALDRSEGPLDPEIQALAWQFSRATAEQVLRSMRYIEEYEHSPDQRWELLRASLERFAGGPR
jgi:hypothetical protein